MEEADSIAHEYLRVTGYTRCIWATEEGEVIKETLAEMSQGHLLTRVEAGESSSSGSESLFFGFESLYDLE